MKKSFSILIIEENPAEVQLIRECIKILEYTADLHVVKTYDEALQFICKRRKFENSPTPDIIISDMTIPGGSAYELLTEIKSNKEVHSIPFVVLTSSDYPEDISLCYSMGAAAIFNKDSELEKLVHTIRKIIELL